MLLTRAQQLVVVVALAVGLVAAVPVPAQAESIESFILEFTETGLLIEFHLGPDGGEPGSDWVDVHGRINADAAGPLGFATDTQTAAFHVERGLSSEVVIESQGVALERWDPLAPNSVAWANPGVLVVNLENGAEPLLCGGTLAQIWLDVRTADDSISSLEFPNFPLPPCPPPVADLEVSLGDAGYHADESGGFFDFVGDTATYEPTIINEGPEDEPVTRFDFRIGYQPETDVAVLDTDFSWTYDATVCSPVVWPFRPTINCLPGALAAGSDVSVSVAVEWLQANTYFTAMTSYEAHTGTFDPDGMTNPLRTVEVIEPEGDFDGDGIESQIDRLGAVWSPLTVSAAFDDGSTSGTITSGSASVADASDPADGVLVTTTASPVSIEACGGTETVAVDAASSAVVTCGSIIVEVVSGTATIQFADGTTVDLDAGDVVEAEGGTFEVLSGSVDVTDDTGTTTTVDAGGVWPPPPTEDTDGDGVLDDVDFCPATEVDSIDSGDLKTRRYAWYGGDYLVAGSADSPMFSIHDTGGCSAEQIIDIWGLGKGHQRFGLSLSALMGWVDYMDSMSS